MQRDFFTSVDGLDEARGRQLEDRLQAVVEEFGGSGVASWPRERRTDVLTGIVQDDAL